MTKLAVLSDIHGNSIALQAILADLDSQGGADHMIVLGDLVVFGPDPVKVLTLLKEHPRIFYVRGNTDRYLIEEQYPRGATSDSWEEQVLASFPWTAEQVGEAGLQFLAGLPRQQYLRFSRQHAIFAVHGSPRSDEENIDPDTPTSELYLMLPEVPFYNLVLCGHTHRPIDRSIANKRIVNVGSVGLPFDGDARASYVLIDLLPGGGYQIESRRVTYNIETVVEQLIAVKHPTTDISTFNLRAARPLSHKLIYTEDMRRGHCTTERVVVAA